MVYHKQMQGIEWQVKVCVCEREKVEGQQYMSDNILADALLDIT